MIGLNDDMNMNVESFMAVLKAFHDHDVDYVLDQAQNHGKENIPETAHFCGFSRDASSRFWIEDSGRWAQ
ncbi:hypothetical protein GWO14_26670 [candidate division KSB1 bacterium]|nr:hypothetical protein [candidate division KSB1 bacterium]